MHRRLILAAAAACALTLSGIVPVTAQTAMPRSRPALPKCDTSDFRVIVDVGHTPEDPGAMSARGIDEYQFNLALAKTIEAHLREAGFTRMHLLLANGQAIPSLIRRIAQANAMSADLLISIHHDSVPEAFKSMWEFEGRQLSYSDRFKGHSIFVSADNANYRGSVAFAKLLGAILKERGLAYTPHYKEAFMGTRRRQLLDAETGVYRYDQLLILRRTQMPSVLLEAGSIVHRDEEEQMKTDAHRTLIAKAITDAVERFCMLRPAKTDRASVR